MNLDVQRLRESYQREYSELPPKRVFVQILLSLIIVAGATTVVGPITAYVLLITFATFNAAFGLAVTTEWKIKSVLYWVSWVTMIIAGFLGTFNKAAMFLYPTAILLITTVTASKVYKES